MGRRKEVQADEARRIVEMRGHLVDVEIGGVGRKHRIRRQHGLQGREHLPLDPPHLSGPA